MGFLLFFASISALLFAAFAFLGAGLFRLFDTAKGKDANVWHTASIARMPLSFHVFVVVVTAMVLIGIYLHGGFESPLPQTFTDPKSVPSILHDVIQKRVAQAALLGFVIAIAGYSWYVERRRHELTIDEAATRVFERAAQANAAGTLPDRKTVAAILASALRRTDPSSLIFLLVLVVSIAVIEGRHAVGALSAKIGLDGVELSLAAQPQTDTNPAYSEFRSEGEKSAGRVIRQPQFALLAFRVDRDIESICGLLQQTVASEMAGSGAPNAASTTPCNIAGLPAKAIAEATRLRPLEDYQTLSEKRTQAMVQCFTRLAYDPANRVVLRTMTEPVLDAYARLMSAEGAWPKDKGSLEKRAPEILDYMKSLAGFHDRTALTGIPFDPPAPAESDPSPCYLLAEFSRELRAELVTAGLANSSGDGMTFDTVCPAATVAAPHRLAICAMLAHETRLPYGVMALATFADMAGEPDEAVLMLERWITNRRYPDYQDIGIVDHWHYFIVANHRNQLLRLWTDSVEGARVERDLTLLHGSATAGSVLQKWAPDFESRIADDPAICADPASTRPLVLTIIKYDTLYHRHNTRLQQTGPVALNNAFARGEPQSEFGDLLGFDRIVNCITANSESGKPVLQSGQRELLTASHLSLRADYQLAYARFMQSLDGKQDSWHIPDLSRDKLLAEARKNLIEARDLLLSIRPKCASKTSSLCVDHETLPKYQGSIAILMGTEDPVTQLLEIVEEKFALIPPHK